MFFLTYLFDFLFFFFSPRLPQLLYTFWYIFVCKVSLLEITVYSPHRHKPLFSFMCCPIQVLFVTFLLGFSFFILNSLRYCLYLLQRQGSVTRWHYTPHKHQPLLSLRVVHVFLRVSPWLHLASFSLTRLLCIFTSETQGYVTRCHCIACVL